MACSEAPDNTGRRAVVILRGAQIMRVHIVALQAPGEILKEELIVGAAANVDLQRVVNEAAGVQMTNAGHGVDERPPLSETGREAWAAQRVVLHQAFAAIKPADIRHQSDAWIAAEREGFVGSIPSAIALLDDDIAELRVGNTDVHVSAGKKAVELGRHWNGAQKPARKRQQRGSSFRHEISLPGLRAGKNSNLINEIR